MKQYLDLLQNIIDNGVEKESGRANMPNTIGISHGVIKMNLQDGFPLLSTKKMYLKGIILELLWFLRGETNIKYLVDNNVNIWNGDAYRWYQTKCNESKIKPYLKTIDDFIKTIKITPIRYDEDDCCYCDNIDLANHLDSIVKYKLGDLGKVYGYQWRNQNGVDQVKDVLDGLKTNPYSRYHVIDAWNKADFNDMALPPCHLLYQFIVRPLDTIERTQLAWDLGLDKEYKELGAKFAKDWDIWFDERNVPKFYLDLNMYQRSCDTLLGVPFNIASMSILLMLFAKVSNMLPGVSTWIGGDTHLYLNHLDSVEEQLNRTPFELPELKINKELNSLEDILNLSYDDFELVGYESHPPIKAELFTGLKK